MEQSYYCIEQVYGMQASFDALIMLKIVYDAGGDLKTNPIRLFCSNWGEQNSVFYEALERIFGKCEVKWEQNQYHEDVNKILIPFPQLKEFFALVGDETDLYIKKYNEMLNGCCDSFEMEMKGLVEEEHMNITVLGSYGIHSTFLKRIARVRKEVLDLIEERRKMVSNGDLVGSNNSENVTGNSVEKEIGNEFVIRLRDDSLPIIEEYQNDIKLGEGLYLHEDVAEALVRSYTTGVVQTPILPRGTLYYTESHEGMACFCFMEVPPHRRTVYYHEAIIEDIPFPRLIFGFELKKGDQYQISKVWIGAVDDQCPNEESEVYYYPYTNVYPDFKVCWGSAELPRLARISQLTTIPELFFGSPNSDCLYSSANQSGMSYRELVETIKGQEFPTTYLKKTGLSLEQWINRLMP